MSFLLDQNNLKDLGDVREARKNLGIGDLADQSSSNVTITGGSIAVSELRLISQVSSNSVLISVDDQGTMGWGDPIFHDWVRTAQSNVGISEFVNDVDFVTSSQLNTVAFTGNYSDLSNTPTSFNDLYENSIYLRSENNLSDLPDKAIARSNLGLGDLATQNKSNVIVDKLVINSELRYIDNDTTDDYHGKYLTLDTDNVARWSDLPIASSSNPGMIQLIDDFLSDSTTQAPTAFALRRAYLSLKDLILYDDDGLINYFIDKYGLLTKNKSLEELQEVAPEVRINLGIGDLAIQNTDNVRVENLIITDKITYPAGLPLSSENSNVSELVVLKSNGNTGELFWDSLPIADSSNVGLVKISDDFIGSSQCNIVVPTLFALSNVNSRLHSLIETVQDNIPLDISELNGLERFLQAHNNLLEVNATVARSNLGLHRVAHTGRYNDLIEHPTHLSDFINDLYSVASSNLSDLTNIEDARSNLGLGNMALQNSNAVQIVGGEALLDKLTINDQFNLYQQGQDITGMFLRAHDSAGQARWHALPRATEEIYGIVNLSHDINVENTDKVASSTAVFQMYSALSERMRVLEEQIRRNIFLKKQTIKPSENDQVTNITVTTEPLNISGLHGYKVRLTQFSSFNDDTFYHVKLFVQRNNGSNFPIVNGQYMVPPSNPNDRFEFTHSDGELECSVYLTQNEAVNVEHLITIQFHPSPWINVGIADPLTRYSTIFIPNYQEILTFSEVRRYPPNDPENSVVAYNIVNPSPLFSNYTNDETKSYQTFSISQNPDIEEFNYGNGEYTLDSQNQNVDHRYPLLNQYQTHGLHGFTIPDNSKFSSHNPPIPGDGSSQTTVNYYFTLPVSIKLFKITWSSRYGALISGLDDFPTIGRVFGVLPDDTEQIIGERIIENFTYENRYDHFYVNDEFGKDSFDLMATSSQRFTKFRIQFHGFIDGVSHRIDTSHIIVYGQEAI